MEWYFKEIERRDSLDSGLNIVVITGIFSAIFYIATNFDYFLGSFLTTIFIVLLCLGVLFSSIALFFLIEAFSNLTEGFDYSARTAFGKLQAPPSFVAF